jgi:hypothetical protein
MNSNQVEKLTKQVQQAIDEGAKPVLRGKVDGNVSHRERRMGRRTREAD